MNALILHHYPQSPVSEKIRTAMGLKNLAWRSVEQSRLPQRPELFAMTGGYRRIPVLQVGADLYCDTLCIFRELERRAPEPSLFPGHGAGLPFAIARWTDGPMFDLGLRVAFAPMADSLPPDLVADRARLYLGPQGDFKKEAADIPHILSQLRPQLGWLEERLQAGGEYLMGARPGMADLLAWFIVWFVRGRYSDAARFFSEFPLLCAWADRMQAIGHGAPTPMTPAEALAIAKAAEPQCQEQADPRDAQGLTPGTPVEIRPVGDSGDAPIAGVVHALTRDMLAITREDPACGRVVVHFPRVGYRVTPV